MTWKRLGLNPQQEWIEENSSGLRRVKTLGGYIMESNEHDIRFGRISSVNDATIVTKSLAYPEIFNSYKSLSLAYSVWSAKRGEVTKEKPVDVNFKKLVESAMAQRTWSAVYYNSWPNDMPDFKKTISRDGLFPWPLAIDIGFLYRLPENIKKDLSSIDSYKTWLQNQIKNNLISMSKKKNDNNDIQIHINNSIWFLKANINTTKKIFTQEEWAIKPLASQVEKWSSEYIPFSSEEKLPSGYVSPILNQAYNQAKPQKSPKEIQNEVLSWLNLKETDLSNDQIDAVYLAIKNLEKGQGFLLADETGYGKGRVLAAISKIALERKIQVLFFTEKKSLFSDFYRDCLAINSNFTKPGLLHSKAKVLNEAGEVVLTIKNNPFTEKDKWVWTTYSQFNRKNPEKIKNILSWINNGKTWLILDEAQNAAGNSTTFESVEKIKQKCNATIFSSATFAKNENQLIAYKSLFEGNKKQWNRLLSAFNSNSNTLRLAITIEWAQKGVFLRREHPPMDLPSPIWVPNTSEMKNQQELFSSWWSSMVDYSKIWNQSFGLYESSWNKLGAALSRASREFSILQKKDYLFKTIKNDKENNIKTVIVSDWTLSSHAARLADKINNFDCYEEDTDININKVNLESIPTWKESWVEVIDQMFDINKAKLLPEKKSKKILEKRNEIVSILNKFPHWNISPFDDLINNLEMEKISCGEISGRNWKLSFSPIRINPKPEENRTIIVNDFNSGLYDCMILTRAGNSGISLHSGIKFKDKRQRHLIEWDVSPDPSTRLQFWGRVRRKDQVIEPLRSTLLIDTPFERKRLSKDAIKQQSLKSHSGNNINIEEGDWTGEKGAFIVKEWLGNNEKAVNILDVHDYDIDRVLNRSIILPENDRDSLITHLITGLDLIKDWGNKRLNQWNYPSRIVRKKWWYGVEDYSLNWEERLWLPLELPTKENVFNELSIHAKGKSISAKEMIDSWQKVWQKLPSKNTKMLKTINWWIENYKFFERGAGLIVTDPDTGQRVRSVVLGFSIPNTDIPSNWSASQIAMHVWLSSKPKPMTLSLSAWLSKSFAFAKPTTKPTPDWFSDNFAPISAMVLVGPAWSVAAWGARNSPQGELIHLQDEFGEWKWGWKMPSQWGWSDMLQSDRELASIDHASEFMKQNPNTLLRFRFSPTDTIDIHPQSNGIIVSGLQHALERMPYPLLKKSSRVLWSEDKKYWNFLIPWKYSRYAFQLWYSKGASPTIPSSHSAWYEKTFKNYDK